MRTYDGTVDMFSCCYTRRLCQPGQGVLYTRARTLFYVQSNVATNMATVASVGLTNYIFEVVTDKSIDDLVVNARLRQTVVPSTYRTKTGALFKVRSVAGGTRQQCVTGARAAVLSGRRRERAAR
jgi:hypothetical protein